ncbi:ECF transporter S component [Clostridium sp.]|uniref:ECF transporter S component n=1 Tax=Clostridium sp. TaxID=1506 RepID=UPI0026395F93|nr:ECF transporter S component [Clostridium sp.]
MEVSKFKKLKVAIISILIPPIILFIGVKVGDRNYWLVSMILIILAMWPFFSLFERRKPRAREIVPIAVMSAIAAIGRFAFAMIPQFKPVAAIVIITGISFGSEAGFLTGAISALVSNFFFGQGPWTPWQMFAFGIIGFLSGLLYKYKIIESKLSICIFGGVCGYLYGLIVNLWTILAYVNPLTKEGVIATYASSIPFDTIHAISTVIFLFILAMPMKEKMERLKLKYGLFR